MSPHNLPVLQGEGKTQLTVDAPKSKAGVRQIPIIPQVRKILQVQRNLYAERKIAAGSIWHDGDFVFCSEIGTPKDAANIRRTLKEALKRPISSIVGYAPSGTHSPRTQSVLVSM